MKKSIFHSVMVIAAFLSLMLLRNEDVRDLRLLRTLPRRVQGRCEKEPAVSLPAPKGRTLI